MQNEARVDENQTLLVSAASPLRERGDLPPQEFDGRRMKLGLMRIRHSWCPRAPGRTWRFSSPQECRVS